MREESAEKIATSLVPGIGRLPIPAYQGDEDYIFVSYAHMDHKIVFPEIKRLNDMGYNVWYDEGISAGSEWDEEITKALEKCKVFIVFLTPDSEPRENVRDEIKLALNEEKNFLAIHLKKTELTGANKLRISAKQAILKYNMSEEEYEYKLVKALSGFGLKQNKKSSEQTSAPKKEEQIPAEKKNVTEPEIKKSGKKSDGKLKRFFRDNGKKAAIISAASAAVIAAVILLFTLILPKIEQEKLPELQIGDTYTFGSYEQDNDASNGKEPIEWQVLDIKDDEALIISKYGLDCRQYNETETDVTWETCTLRKWLNEDFLNNAFTPEEQEKIPESDVPAHKNPEYDTDPGNATKDKIFLLSTTEAKKYFTTKESRRCAPTALAMNEGEMLMDGTECCDWWLRSPGVEQTASYVNCYGATGKTYYAWANVAGTSGVRPALWIKCNALADKANADTKTGNEENVTETDFDHSAEKMHTWGDWKPQGTAVIETEDGSKYTAVANSLTVFSQKGVFESLDDGFETGDNNILYFFSMKMIEKNGEALDVAYNDGKTYQVTPVEGSKLFYIGENNTGDLSEINLSDIKKISFDRDTTPSVSISYCKVGFADSCYYTPINYLYFEENVGDNIPDIDLLKDMTKYSGSPLTLFEIKKIEVTKNSTTDGDMFTLPDEMELKVYRNSGEPKDIVIDDGYFDFVTIAQDGYIKSPLRTEIKYIEMPD